MSLKNIDASEAAKLMEDGALLVDVRETHEYARTHIPGSENMALSGLGARDIPVREGQKIVFLCASGNRTNMNAPLLAAKAGAAEAYCLAGGISAWQRSGLPVASAPGGGGLFARVFGG